MKAQSKPKVKNDSQTENQTENKITEITSPEKSLVIAQRPPTEVDGMFAQADILLKSGFLPAQVKTPQQAVAIMLRGKELGLPPMEALANLFVVNGKVAAQTQTMLALIYRSGQAEDIAMERGDPCKVTMKRKGMTPHTVTFGKKDAVQIGVINKDVYKKFPETMYLWRAIAMCARVVFPDVISGVYTPDELGVEIASDIVDGSFKSLGNGFDQPKEDPHTLVEFLSRLSEFDAAFVSQVCQAVAGVSDPTDLDEKYIAEAWAKLQEQTK